MTELDHTSQPVLTDDQLAEAAGGLRGAGDTPTGLDVIRMLFGATRPSVPDNTIRTAG